MAKYCFAAVFTPEETGYSVDFPDLEGCYTCGDDLQDALYMAQDVLNYTLCDLENEGKAVPAPTPSALISLQDGEFTTYVLADTAAYRRAHDNRAVKKTLTIPQWLNAAAEAANVNFSQTLQEALTAKLGIS